MFKKELTNKGIGRFVETFSAALGRRREDGRRDRQSS
jgi:hypothetical protein